LDIVAACDAEAEIGARHNAEQDRGKRERHCGREEGMRDQSSESDGDAGGDRASGEDRGLVCSLHLAFS